MIFLKINSSTVYLEKYSKTLSLLVFFFLIPSFPLCGFFFFLIPSFPLCGYEHIFYFFLFESTVNFFHFLEIKWIGDINICIHMYIIYICMYILNRYIYIYKYWTDIYIHMHIYIFICITFIFYIYIYIYITYASVK